MRRAWVLIAVVGLTLGAVVAPLVFLKMRGGGALARLFGGPSPGWIAVGLVIAAAYVATAWILTPPGHPDTPRRGDAVRRVLARPPMRILIGLLYGAMFMGFMVAFTSAFGGRSGSLLIAALGNLPMGLMMAGMTILGGAVLRRHGPPRCVKCGYDLSGPPEGGYDRCPECGADARAPAAIVRERREINRSVLVTGVVLAAAPFVWFFFAFRAPLLSRGWYLPYVPTGSLIAEVTAAPRGFTMTEWAELGTRTLTSAQERRLFEGLLELRDSRGHVDRAAETFLDRVAESGTLSPALRERYYAGMLRSRLGVLGRMESDGACTVVLVSEFNGPLGPTAPRVGVVVTHFEIGGVPITGPERTSNVGTPIRGLSAEMEPGPSVELRPEDWRGQDEVKVRAVGWVYVLPPGGSSVYGDPLVFPSDTRRTAALDASITLRKQ